MRIWSRPWEQRRVRWSSPRYLELTDPAIPDAIATAVSGGASTVRILPCFLHPGNHVLVDLPGIAEQARRTHPGVAVELLPHLGSDPSLVRLLVRIIDA